MIRNVQASQPVQLGIIVHFHTNSATVCESTLKRCPILIFWMAVFSAWLPDASADRVLVSAIPWSLQLYQYCPPICDLDPLAPCSADHWYSCICKDCYSLWSFLLENMSFLVWLVHCFLKYFLCYHLAFEASGGHICSSFMMNLSSLAS